MIYALHPVFRFSFFGFRTIHLRDDEPGDERGSWLSQFISVSEKMYFSVFTSFKVKFFKKIPKDNSYLNKENSDSVKVLSE